MSKAVTKKNKGGQPTVMTPETVKRLEEAFAFGASDREACLFADISPATLYNYQEKNPEFLERKNVLKENPVMLARQTVVRHVQRDPRLAFEYLKSKRADEFGSTTNITQAVQVNFGELKDKYKKEGK